MSDIQTAAATPSGNTAQSSGNTTQSNTPAESNTAEQAQESVQQSPYDFEEPADVEIPAEAQGEESATSTTDDNSGGDAQETKTAGETTPALDPELLLLAGGLGLSKDEALAFGSSEQLRAAIRILDTRMQASQQQQVQQQAPAQKEPEKVEPEFKLELSEDIDPEIRKTVQGMHEHYTAKVKQVGELRSQVQQLNDTVSALMSHVRSEQANQFKTWFDGKVEGLGKEYKDVIGKDGGEKILRSMDIITSGYQNMKQPLPTREELFSQAVRLSFGDKMQTVARKQVVQQVQKREKQIIGRPTHRETRDIQDPTRRAIAAVTKQMRATDADVSPTEAFE